MQSLVKLPPVRWAMKHPRLAAWIALSVGMIALLAIEASDIGLFVHQWVAVIVACILVAGACIWIVSWEDDDGAIASPADTSPADKPAEQPNHGGQ